MIKLGFYENENELIQLVDPLITLLDGSLDQILEDQDDFLKQKSHSVDIEEAVFKQGN